MKKIWFHTELSYFFCNDVLEMAQNRLKQEVGPEILFSISMFGGAYGDARMPNRPHWHRTPLPGIATMGQRRDKRGNLFSVSANTIIASKTQTPSKSAPSDTIWSEFIKQQSIYFKEQLQSFGIRLHHCLFPQIVCFFTGILCSMVCDS